MSHHDNQSHLTDRFESIIGQARNELGDLDQQARNLVHERPMVALLGAVGLGYFVARLSSRI